MPFIINQINGGLNESEASVIEKAAFRKADTGAGN